MGKYISELRHWGLIEQLPDGRYWATQLAHDFLAGKVAIASWTWPKGEKLPPECVDGPARFIHEMTDEHPKQEKGMHVELAKAEAERAGMQGDSHPIA